MFKKGVIYEVKLIDWVERTDIDGDGNMIKTVIQEAPKKEWEKPTDLDEITLNAHLSLADSDPSLATH